MSDETEQERVAQAELAAWDQIKAWQDEEALTFDAMTRQNIEYHDRIIDLENALRQIAGKRKLDACAAASMQAIAKTALKERK